LTAGSGIKRRRRRRRRISGWRIRATTYRMGPVVEDKGRRSIRWPRPCYKCPTGCDVTSSVSGVNCQNVV